MEAGYDYLLLRGRLQRRLFRYSGIFIFLFGAVLLAASGTYYGYAANARADLDRLNVAVPGGTSTLDIAAPNLVSFPFEQVVPGMGLVEPAAGSAAEWDAVSPAPAMLRPQVPAIAIGSQRLYPGESLLASAWSDPQSYAPLSYREQILLQRFTPVEIDQSQLLGTLPAATRIIVPSIGVDSTVKELQILDLGGSRAYETPDRAVGHIPETAEAGEAGASWFFGHTESPTLGEGSVFFNLQKIPEKLLNGEDVFIITDNGRNQYLYRATSSQVVHQSEMRLYETGKATIHLVSCLPRLVYDHRLIISGELVGQRSDP
jgi:sortase (surface protein transpeptidase)